MTATSSPLLSLFSSLRYVSDIPLMCYLTAVLQTQINKESVFMSPCLQAFKAAFLTIFPINNRLQSTALKVLLAATCQQRIL